jgi:DNA-directed RNA polymerase subunit RPC12/RpoP
MKMEIYKCLHCGYEFYRPIKDEECPNCGSVEIVRTEEGAFSNGWTKAWKELPGDNGWYLTITEHKSVIVLQFNVKHQMWNVGDNYTDSEIKVLYWRKLPPMPLMRELPPYDMDRDIDIVNRAFKKEEDK